jgi:hypothetical protein
MKTFTIVVLSGCVLGCASHRECPAPSSPPPPRRAQAMTIATRYCDVEYDAGLVTDGQLIADLVDAGTAALLDEFGAASAKFFEQTTCRFHVVSFRSSLTKEGHTGAYGFDRDGEHSVDAYFFAPSLHDPKAVTAAGEPMDRDYFAKNVVYALSGPILWGMSAEKSKGWRFGDAPRWLTDGYAELLACTRSTPKVREVVLRKYVSNVKADPTRVVIGSKIEVKDTWTDGSTLLAFVQDQFGRDSVHSLITSPMPTFDAALDEIVGPDRAALAAKFSAWLQKQP